MHTNIIKTEKKTDAMYQSGSLYMVDPKGTDNYPLPLIFSGQGYSYVPFLFRAGFNSVFNNTSEMLSKPYA